jgi:hypothetical protein
LAGLSLLLIFFYIAVAVFVFIAWAQIFTKAGYSGWLCLLFLIPIVNIVIFFWFAFSNWPVRRERDTGPTLPS